MTRRLLSVVSLSLLVACGGNVDAAGHYETTPESVIASFEATFPPPEDEVGQMARARFEQMRGDLTRVELDLEPDGTFLLTMMLPGLPKPVDRTGTWTQHDATVELHATHERGQELPEPKSTSATLAAGTIALQDNPHTPRFVLEKK